MPRNQLIDAFVVAIACTAAYAVGTQLDLYHRVLAEPSGASPLRVGDLVLPCMVLCVAVGWFGLRRARDARRELTRGANEQARKRAFEQRELETRKLQALGTFAGGIAHEFNNALVSVLGYGELLAERLEPESDDRADLDVMMSAAERARDLVVQILTFCRKARVRARPVDVDTVVANAFGVVRATYPEGVQLRHLRSRSGVRVMADPNQLEQVVLQLCRNAADAMLEGGGTVEVEVGPRTIADRAVAQEIGVEAGDFALLTVRDTGHGMDSSTRLRIFDPFYTTKDPGEGTGLGLSVVHGIVSGYGGAIRVTSSRGQGSTFEVYIPCAAELQVAQPANEPARGGNERVLLVEDDPNNARLARRLLERAGYEVTVCAQADEALAHVELGSFGFDLLVTDLTMPGCSGTELVRRLHEVRPEAPAIVVSGHNDVDTEKSVRESGAHGLVPKPFTSDDLLRAVRHALEHAPRSDDGSPRAAA